MISTVPKDISYGVYSFMHPIIEGERSNMPFCPECGGAMRYSSATKRYACQSCGLSVTHQELIEMREQMRPPEETEQEQRQRQRKEYLKWWLSDKKK
jgi:tRNA(Ile2) C34 agmatinyltransferase TiaS